MRASETHGYVEGQNVTLEFRWAEGHYERLPALAAELVRHPAKRHRCRRGFRRLWRAKAATSTIPIVFSSAGDPVRLGVVASLNRPGGNITSSSSSCNLFCWGQALATARNELMPGGAVIAVLENPNNPRTDLEVAGIAGSRSHDREAAPHCKGWRVRRFDNAIHKLLYKQEHGGLLVAGEPLFHPLCANNWLCWLRGTRLPAIYDYRDFTAAGEATAVVRNRSEGDVSA